MAQNSVNPNNNRKKADDIMQLWYKATGEKFGKVNLATNADFENSKLAGKKQYIQAVKDKAIPLVYERVINLRKGQRLHLVFHANTHYFDLDNPELGIEDNINKVSFKYDLQNKRKSDKTVVMFTGNFFGKEWKMGNLNMATITDNSEILFWGIKERVKAFINDIKFAAKNGADEIILMNGREEHDIKKKLGLNVEEAAIMDRFNDLLFKYAIEIVKNDQTDKEMQEVIKHKNVTIAYVPGAKKIFNFSRLNSENKLCAYSFSMHTITKSTSEKVKKFIDAAEKQHAGIANADANFIQGENVIGYEGERDVYVVSGQSTYKSTTRGNLPGYAPKGRSSCTLYLGEKSHKVQVLWGSMNFVDEQTYIAQRKLAKEMEIEDYTRELIEEKLEAKYNELAQRHIEKGE